MGVSRTNGVGQRKFRRNYPDRSKLNMQTGLRHGFRSGFEEKVAADLQAKGVPVSFETCRVPYLVPQTKHTYTPDITLPNGILVELKGKLEPKDRAKTIFVLAQNPTLDLRFVFMRPNDKINKGSPTTYAAWCEKNNIKWAARFIPQEWINEPGPQRKPWEDFSKC